MIDRLDIDEKTRLAQYLDVLDRHVLPTLLDIKIYKARIS